MSLHWQEQSRLMFCGFVKIHAVNFHWVTSLLLLIVLIPFLSKPIKKDVNPIVLRGGSWSSTKIRNLALNSWPQVQLMQLAEWSWEHMKYHFQAGQNNLGMLQTELIYIYIYVCIWFYLFNVVVYFWLHGVFVAVQGLSLIVGERALLFTVCTASHCEGFSCWAAWALDTGASVFAALQAW